MGVGLFADRTVRIECPTCKTSYTASLCGIQPGDDTQRVTVVCIVCQKAIEAIIEPAKWYQRGSHRVMATHER